MRVHLIKKQTIEDYCTKRARGMPAFHNWLETIKYADRGEPGDIKRTFNSADFLGDGSDRVIFNIGGNNYRMICKYHFGKKTVHLFVCWIGTHADYDKLCDKGEQYSVNKYECQVKHELFGPSLVLFMHFIVKKYSRSATMLIFFALTCMKITTT